MTRSVGKLADRLLSAVVPKTKASAATLQCVCNPCGQYRRGSWCRLCDQFGCSAWYSNGCGSC